MSNAAPSGSKLRDFRRRMAQVPARAWPGLNKALRGLSLDDAAAVTGFERRLANANAEVALKRDAKPNLRYDEALPMVAERETMLSLLQRHQVVVVAGSTGCGKSTQLPKLLLEAGYGCRGLIGVTQPRRIAARSLSRRVADELGEAVGGRVGWQVRFSQNLSPESQIKFMTDGILLAETQGDRELRGYDAIIVDEVHERSLNIDFLLGYLQRLLPKRPDLKLILASATLDTDRFAAHFGGAPVLAVEGRGHPVEIRHRPLASEEKGEDLDLYQGISAAISELSTADPRGDVLVFLPGEREIRDAHRHLEGAGLRHTEIVPLYGRLSATLQDKVFKPGGGRRVVLATNVAETSLTVPRIKFVIDSGLARVMRYAPRTQVQRLQIEPISQAAAAQRAGRCGRTSPGVCIRLYAETDHARRPEFTDPELLRSSLAGVILSMLSLRLGDPDHFPFLDPPARRLLHEGWQVLVELGAVDDKRRLTEIGRYMAKLPIDVRMARMLVAARDRDALDEGLIIAAALSVQDPRERPAERQGEADQRHAVWRDERSDFLGWINLWRDFDGAAADLNQRGLRDWCGERLLSFPKMREWRELHRQLKLLVKGLDWTLNAEPASYEALHQAILVAYLSHIGERDPKQDYRGPRQRRFRPFPSSALARSGGRWLVAASLLETRRLYALQVARIEQKWIEPLAGHMLKRQHYEPQWDAAQAQAWCYEDLLLDGLPVVRRRRTRLAPLEPDLARELMLRHGLVRGEWRLRHPCLAQHRELFAEAEAKEEKLRRRGLLRDELELAAWFDQRIPAQINDGRSLMAWLRKADAPTLQKLRLSISDLVIPEATESELSLYPPTLEVDGLVLPLSYCFDPQDEADGVSIAVSIADLGRISADQLEWLVPGLRKDKVVALIKGLPKALRRHYVPAPDYAHAFLEAHPVAQGSLLETLAAFLTRVTGAEVSRADFAQVALPPHLQFMLQVLDGEKPTANGRNPQQLITQLAEQSQRAFAQRARDAFSEQPLQRFPDQPIAQSARLSDGAVAYPALTVLGNEVVLRGYVDPNHAATRHRDGVRHLLRLRLDDVIRYWRRHLPLSPQASLQAAPIGGTQALAEDLIDGAFLALSESADQIRQSDQFAALSESIRAQLGPAVSGRAEVIEGLLVRYGELRRRMEPPMMGFAAANLADLRSQLERLLGAGFAGRWSPVELQNIDRYLHAAQLRLERLLVDPSKDQAKQLEIAPFDQALAELKTAGRSDEELDPLRWAIEEFRVSIFAQELGTAMPVSAKRLNRLVHKLRRQTEEVANSDA